MKVFILFFALIGMSVYGQTVTPPYDEYAYLGRWVIFKLICVV